MAVGKGEIEMKCMQCKLVREALKKITILLLTFVNKRFTPPPLFIDEKPLYKPA